MTVTVLSGPERRRRWTTAEKLRIVQESQAPDAMVSEIARRHDIHPNQLHSWRRQVRTGVLADADAGHGAREGTRFAAVAIAPASVLPAAPSDPAAGVIEIEFAAGGRMRITGGVEACLVSAAIETLARSQRR
jgi:transposase